MKMKRPEAEAGGHPLRERLACGRRSGSSDALAMGQFFVTRLRARRKMARQRQPCLNSSREDYTSVVAAAFSTFSYAE